MVCFLHAANKLRCALFSNCRTEYDVTNGSKGYGEGNDYLAKFCWHLKGLSFWWLSSVTPGKC